VYKNTNIENVNSVRLIWRAVKDKKVKDFVEYFHAHWLQKKGLWFTGAAPGYPLTNNGLEGTNSSIKREHILRERLPVGQFVRKIVDLVRKWSEDRDPLRTNYVAFCETPTVPLKLWTSAYHWALENRKVLQRKGEGHIRYYTTASGKQPITARMLTEYDSKNGVWDSFEDFVEYYRSIWVVTVLDDVPKTSSCTCPAFAKKSLCKHSLGMKIRQKLVTLPEEAKGIPLGQKRKRGRPARAKRALLIQ